MLELPFEERISAYLDGELPAHERQLVEQQIAESAPLRQLYEELKRQHEMLGGLPKYQPSPDLAARVIAKIHSTVPASTVPASTVPASTVPASTVPASTVPASAVPASVVRDESYARSSRSTNRYRGIRKWPRMVAAGTVVALTLLLLVAIVPWLLDNGTAKRPNVPAVPDPDRIAQLAAFEQEFSNKFGYLMVYDFAITPEGQRDRIFEKWMEIAGLHVDKTISIEERLEKDLLNCRFVGDDKIIAGGIVKDVSKDDVEMIFVRSTGGKIDTLQRLESFYRARVKDKIHLRIDLAETPPEMQVFLQLNDAASPYRGDGLAFRDTWSQPGTYRLQFRLGLHSMSFSRLGVVSGPAFKPEVTSDAKENSDEITFAPPPPLPKAKLSDAGTRDIDPSQVLIIVRRLKEDFTSAVDKAPTSGSAEK